ncbi:MAG: hypothetical protein RBR36_05170 [Bacilli bacterium]|jgi:hypothetical protein|nr:hypothetical protein [Acholeplasmataceae bacterium]MDY0400058.1 hypothetical protein [Bacilli bacterium]
MDKREYLSRYHEAEKKIKKLQALHDEYDRLSFNVPGCNFDQIRVSGTRNLEAPFVKWIHKAMEVQYEIDELRKNLETIKNEILDCISAIGNSEYERLLIYRYIDWENWQDIADKMFYSKATIRRWHDLAIAEIKVPEKLSTDEQS